MEDLPKHCQAELVEDKWYQWWCENRLFSADPAAGGEPYCIVIPPPNVTGILHMGHALNNTIQDVLVRRERMLGRNVVWVPGTDHAGIATQNVVERQLAKDGVTREDLTRGPFIERVWAWRDQYGHTITQQLRKLGASCDWERERFTMDEGLSAAVNEVFIRLYEKGLIYRGNYIINWCPRCQTALSDEESEHQAMAGNLYYIRYPLKGGKAKDFVVVATTRPETMLGDTAVAVNPRDERYKAMIGKTLVLPLIGREIPVVADDFVDPDFGTGAVKVTPAHDPNDYEMGLRHDLEQINVMNDDATMGAAAGAYAGMDRFECRRQMLADLEAQKLLDRQEPHQHAVGHCYRCDTMVEPRLSPQWFVKMKPLAEPALEAVKDGRISFVPDRWTKVYEEWMENIRDWCISRQIWWGHRIPVFYCDACTHEWVARDEQLTCPKCGSDRIRQDEDVLDTWFSSWLWPFSVFGWPEASRDLEFYYPTNTLVTASEIIFFWVARMVMAGMEFMGEIPFEKVYIHGTVRDDQGRKMSKSLGNSIDPLDVIEKYSADALRFSLIMLTATGQDVYLSDEKFELGRNFGTKIWNAARFMQMQSRDFEADILTPSFDPDLLSSEDRNILYQLARAVRLCDENLAAFRFNDMAKGIYDFIWHHYCDWYLEYSKEILYGDDQARRSQVLTLMHFVFSNALKLLHPLMPFITEELWHGMGYNRTCESIMRAPWPNADDICDAESLGVTDDIIAFVDAKHDLIRVARILMADYNITPKKSPAFAVRPSSDAACRLLQLEIGSIRNLLGVDNIEIDAEFEPQEAMPSSLSKIGPVYMSLEGMVDVAAEIERLEKKIAENDKFMLAAEKKLSNPNFVDKAPAAVVAQQQQRKESLSEERKKLKKLLASLQ